MEVTENCSFKDALGSDGTFPIKKLVPAKNKFLGPGKPMMLGAGFPDFISFKYEITKFIGALNGPTQTKFYEVIGVESKSNGQLNKIEKEKCTWLLKNNIFSKILIASKGTKRGEIIYKDFNNNN